MSAFPVIAGIDGEDAAQRLGGNLHLFRSLLTQSRSAFDAHLQAARRAFRSGEHADTARHIHALRGLLGNLGAREAMELAAQTERALRHRDVASAQESLARLERVVAVLAMAIADSLAAGRATPLVAAAVLDPAALAELLALLDEHDADALDCYDRTRHAIAGRLGHELSARLSAAIEALQFGEAAAIVRSMEAAR